MPKQRLQKILQDLRNELDHAEALTDADKDQLAGVVDTIHSVLDDDGRDPDESMLSSLDDAALHFEAEHPTVTKVLSQISELLRSAGLS